MERELILNALSIFNLREGVKVEEIRHAYFEKMDQKQFKKIILSDQHLEREFLRYHGSYLILLKHYSEIGDETYFSNYASDLVFKFFFELFDE